jgi:hypothetical protein
VDAVLGLASGTNAGTYADTLNGATGTGLSNYDITYVNGGITINKRSLTLTADDMILNSGIAIPNLTYRIGGMGLVLGDQLFGSLATNATSTSPAGIYQITLGTLAASGNYEMTFISGKLTINEQPDNSPTEGPVVLSPGQAIQVLNIQPVVAQAAPEVQVDTAGCGTTGSVGDGGKSLSSLSAIGDMSLGGCAGGAF